MITSTIDPRDHHFILGSTNPALQPLSEVMAAAAPRGTSGLELQALEDAWVRDAKLKPFHEAVADTIHAGVHADKAGLERQFLAAAQGKSNAEARAIAKALIGVDVFFDWEAARTREGYYRYRGGVPCAVTRGTAYAPYADLLWMESQLPDYAQAREFAEGVHAAWPEQKCGPVRVRRITTRLTRAQARVQPVAVVQLEDGHDARRAGDVHCAARGARLLLAVHHAGGPAPDGAHGGPLFARVCAAGHARLRRDRPGAREAERRRRAHASEVERRRLRRQHPHDAQRRR